MCAARLIGLGKDVDRWDAVDTGLSPHSHFYYGALPLARFRTRSLHLLIAPCVFDLGALLFRTILSIIGARRSLVPIQTHRLLAAAEAGSVRR